MIVLGPYHFELTEGMKGCQKKWKECYTFELRLIHHKRKQWSCARFKWYGQVGRRQLLLEGMTLRWFAVVNKSGGQERRSCITYVGLATSCNVVYDLGHLQLLVRENGKENQIAHRKRCNKMFHLWSSVQLGLAIRVFLVPSTVEHPDFD
mmetsp:Transcript_51514/g.154657  ORF Transcript_51514/g.154657 Transcript_51514/m.154657 type:complete len:150 (-) Transcript_51514:69-518(-)